MLLARLAHHVAWPDAGQQLAGLRGGEIPLRPTRDELEQQLMKLTHHPGVLLTEAPTPVDQQPQQLELLVIDDSPKTAHAHADQGDRVGVGVVGLAALPGGEDPYPRRQLRRHVHHGLALGDEALRDMAADPLTALDRPYSVRPGRDVGQHRGESLGIGGEPATTGDLLVACHHLDGHRPLVRVHADHDAVVVIHAALPSSSTDEHQWSQEGTATTSRAFPS